MKAIDEFPFEWIAKDLREGKCIPFLGAGASAFPKEINAKPPSASALALELAKESMYPPYQAIRDAAGANDAAAQERLLRATVECENLMLVSSWVEHGLGIDRGWKKSCASIWRTSTDRCPTTRCTICWRGSRSSDRWLS